MSSNVEEATEEKLAKRPRLGGLKRDTDAAAVTFDDLGNDCLVCILSFLQSEEMIDATLINSAFREARNADSLDQTRTATIIIVNTERRLSVYDLFATIQKRGWYRLFTEGSNYKCLKIVGHAQGLKGRPMETGPARMSIGPYVDFRRLWLESVTSLDLSLPQRDEMPYRVIKDIPEILPYLKQMDLSCVSTELGESVLGNIAGVIWRLDSIKCNGSQVYVGTRITRRQVGNLFEVQLDDAALWGDRRIPRETYSDEAIFYSDLSETETYLFMQFGSLERVSMKNATWHLKDSEETPIPQNILIKLVRRHPTLRWLRSDLTDQNIAMLKLERPEMTLINK